MSLNSLAERFSGRLWRAILLVLFVLFILMPFVIILLEAFGKDWFGLAFLPAKWTFGWFTWAIETVNIPQVLLNTFVIAGMVTVFSLVVSIPAAWALARYRIRAKPVLVGLVLFPRMIPEITFALGVAKVFYAVNLENTYLGIALAHLILAAPFAVLVLMSAFEGMDARLLEAGQVLGCNPGQLFYRVILPLAMPSVLAAAIFSFLASYNDFVLTLMLYGPNTTTLPVQTYLSIGNGYTSVASAISVILLIPATVFMVLLLRWIRPENLLGGLKGT